MAGFKRRSSSVDVGSHENLHALAKKIKEEEDILIEGVYLNEETNSQISRLFKIIDCNSDGCVDVNDFTVNGSLPTGPLAAKWAEIRDKFDFDGDGQVTLEEFRHGFKKMVLKLSCQVQAIVPPNEMTIEGCIRALEKHVNEQIQELCKAAFLWYKQI